MHLNTSLMNYGRIICGKSILLYSSIDLDFVCMIMSSYKIISQHFNWIIGKAARSCTVSRLSRYSFSAVQLGFRTTQSHGSEKTGRLWWRSWSGVVSPQFLKPYIHITAKPPEDSRLPGWLAGGYLLQFTDFSIFSQNLFYWIIFPFSDFTA